MKYDVLINYTKNFRIGDVWKAYSFNTFNEIIYQFKNEIKSLYAFVYVRKRFEDKNLSTEICTKFKLITKTSYTFSHYYGVEETFNSFLAHKFIIHSRSL